MTTPPSIQLSADGITWGAPGAPLSVASGLPFNARLSSTAGVDSTTWQVLSTDDVGSAPALTPSGIANSQVGGVASSAGTAFILLATVNGGIDGATGKPNPFTTTATAKVWVPATNGLEVMCFDEHAEHGAQWWLPLVNAAIRGAAGGKGLALSPITAPSTPLSGARVYFDSADNRLKGRDSNGVVFPLDSGWLTFNSWALVTGTSYVASACELVLVDTSNAVTVTLRSAVGMAGKMIRLKDATNNAQTHNITVATTGGQTIDGNIPVPILTNAMGRTYISDGSNWHVVNQN